MGLSGERAEAHASAKAFRPFLNCPWRDHRGIMCLEGSKPLEKYRERMTESNPIVLGLLGTVCIGRDR